MADFTMELDDDYDVLRVEIDGQLNILSEVLDGMKRRTNRFDLAIVAAPDSAFDPKDQVILDQFIMNGGRVLWLIDPLLTNRDSLAANQMTMATSKDLGISDQLYQYGVRFNRNLVVDAQCAPMLMDAGPNGDQRNMQVFNWYFATRSDCTRGEPSHHNEPRSNPFRFCFEPRYGGRPRQTEKDRIVVKF